MKQIFESENICFVEVSELLVKEYLAMVNDIENVARLIGRGADQISEEKERRWVCGKTFCWMCSSSSWLGSG